MPTTRRGILDFQQDPEYVDLVQELEGAGWMVGGMSMYTDGFEATIRPRTVGPAAGSPERKARGRDEKEAVRNALNQIKAA